MANINFSIEGLESIQEEYDKIVTNKIRKPIKAGLKALDSDMRAMLKGYIQADVYEKYKPHGYIRRAEYPEYGTSISDMDGNVDSLIFDNILRFSYVPNGRHSLYAKAPYVDGDTLITVLETAKGYPWLGDARYVIGERPFWTNFCTELFDHDQAEYSFINGFNANSGDIGKLTPEFNTELSASDDYTFLY